MQSATRFERKQFMPSTTGGVAGLCEGQRACGETMTELCGELPSL